MSKVIRPLRALFLGAPGSGKGTQVSRLIRDFNNVPAISSGDVLRENIEHGTDVGKRAASIIKEGGLVPDSTMISLITGELQARGWLNSEASWLLDGFPRTVTQAPPLDTILEKWGAPLDLVVELKVPEEVILDRIENRWVHLKSGRVYNLTFNPPKVPGKDDITGEELSKRPDDNPAVFKQRLDKYHDLTTPLLDYYGKKGLVRTFEGETSDIIYPKLKSYVQAHYAQ